MSIPTVREHLRLLPGSSRCPHEECDGEFDAYSKLYAHLWYHKGLPDTFTPVYHGCPWPSCDDRDIEGEHNTLFHLMRHAQSLRHVCSHLIQWEHGHRVLCKKLFPDQRHLNQHRERKHRYESHLHRAKHPWIENQDATLERAELIGLSVDASKDGDESDDREDNEDNDSGMEDEFDDAEQDAPEAHLTHEQQDIPAVVAQQNSNHRPQIYAPTACYLIDVATLDRDNRPQLELQEMVDPLPLPHTVHQDLPRVMEASVAADHDYFNNLNVPQAALPWADMFPPVPNDETARYMAAYDFLVSYASQYNGLVAGDVGDANGFYQQAQHIDNFAPVVNNNMMTQAYFQQDFNAGEAQQGMPLVPPFADQAPANGSLYDNLQPAPLAVLPHGLFQGGYLDTQPVAANVVQPEMLQNNALALEAFTAATHPAPYSAALIMLAQAQPDLGIEALSEGQAVDVVVRLRRANHPMARHLQLDPATGTPLPLGVAARILRTNFVNNDARIQF